MKIDALTLDTFVRESGISFKENNSSFIFDCPKCGKAEKVYMYKEGGYFRCFVCSEELDPPFKGGPDWILAELLNIKRSDVRIALGLNAEPQATPRGVGKVELINPYGEARTKEEIPEVEFDPEYVRIGGMGALKGREYLNGRGIPTDIAGEYGIMWSEAKKRVIFPVYMDGKLYGWQGRTTLPTEVRQDDGTIKKYPKVVNLEHAPLHRTLMFHDRLKGSPHAVLCEGPVDALKCHRIGGNVAAMGKQVSVEQLNLIRDQGIKKLYIALDPDAGAEIRRVAQLVSDMELYLLQPPVPYKDLGEMSIDEVYASYFNAPRFQTWHASWS